jgi:autotransporter passenger strand-loop-strand repeat protein
METISAPPNRTNFVLNDGDTLNVLIGGQTDFTTINSGGAENVTAGLSNHKKINLRPCG